MTYFIFSLDRNQLPAGRPQVFLNHQGEVKVPPGLNHEKEYWYVRSNGPSGAGWPSYWNLLNRDRPRLLGNPVDLGIRNPAAHESFQFLPDLLWVRIEHVSTKTDAKKLDLTLN